MQSGLFVADGYIIFYIRMIYKGSCHCGKIAFTVEGEIGSVIDCNCSMCRRRGGLLWFVPRESLVLATPESDMSTYRFNKKLIAHHFCPVCGIAPFGEGVDAEGVKTAAVNVRCLEGVDLENIVRVPYDGRSA